MKKRNIIIAVTDLFLLIVMAALVLYTKNQENSVSMQFAADLWSGEDPDTAYSVVSLYMSADSAKNIDGIYTLKKAVAQKLTQQSVSELSDRGTKNYTDCWYGCETVAVSSDRKTVAVSVFFVGGDYYRVHLPDMVSGNFISPDDINPCCIVLDDNASWQLFGATDTAGMTVTVGNVDMVVSGVSAAPSKKGTLKSAYDGTASVYAYVPYEAAGMVKGSEALFTGYDALLPDHVSHFAEKSLKEAAGVNEKTVTMAVSDSRSRFCDDNIKELAKHMNRFVSRSNTAILPYWETAANEAALYITLAYKAKQTVLVPLLISAVYWLTMLYKLLVKLKNKAVSAVEYRSEEHKKKIYFKKQQEKQEQLLREQKAPPPPPQNNGETGNISDKK